MHSLAFSFPFSVSLTKDVPASKKHFYLCFYCQECPSPHHFLPHAPLISTKTPLSSLLSMFSHISCLQVFHRGGYKKNPRMDSLCFICLAWSCCLNICNTSLFQGQQGRSDIVCAVDGHNCQRLCETWLVFLCQCVFMSVCQLLRVPWLQYEYRKELQKALHIRSTCSDAWKASIW